MRDRLGLSADDTKKREMRNHRSGTLAISPRNWLASPFSV
ncbi:unnamed protein product [Protopolystoma xenopodis]|uniref:Uncharacterized protein n=1 Tax=Protopolystoma xenopodis TaxID=117903 RepID=A0A3S5CIN1_9PLAT|nr:unnamed protein product [Protopolystoma xenopodis]